MDDQTSAAIMETWGDVGEPVARRLMDLAGRLPEDQGGLAKLASVLIAGLANEVEGALADGPLSPMAQLLLDAANGIPGPGPIATPPPAVGDRQ